MTDFEQQVTEIEVHGFTIVPDVIDIQQVNQMRQVLIDSDSKRGELTYNRGVALKLPNLVTLDPVFFTCIDHPRILPLMEHFLEQSLILASLVARIVRPGDPVQGLHSDIPAKMLNRDSPVMMNGAWMLDDFCPENGGTRFVPGSHLNRYADPPEGFDPQHLVQPRGSAGSVIVFNGQLWHGGGGNNRKKSRHAIFSTYRKDWLVFQWDPHDDFPVEWLDRLNQRQRELLRMTRGVGAPHASEEHLLR